jgi:hypothetical protein
MLDAEVVGANRTALVAEPFGCPRRHSFSLLLVIDKVHLLGRRPCQKASKMPQGDYIELHQKRNGFRMDHFERK